MSGIDDDPIVRPHNRHLKILHGGIHFLARDTNTNAHPDTRKPTPHRKSTSHNQDPVGTTGDRDTDNILRHDALLTANHLWPGKPKPKSTNENPSQNLQLDGRVHDWVMRKNNTNADALVRTARQEYHNSVNKHDSYY
jgi:hypothetical protein